MSMLIGFQNDDAIIMAADTAFTTRVNGELVRLPWNFRKISVMGPFVVFACGQAGIYEWFADRFNRSKEKTIEMLRQTLRDCNREYADRHQEEYNSLDEKTRGLAILAAEYKPDGVITYMLNKDDDFEIHSFKQTSFETRHFTGGYYADEALLSLNKLTSQRIPVDQIINRVFKKYSGAEVGGNIVTVILDKHGARFLPERPIGETLKVRVYDPNKYYSVASLGNLVGALIKTNGDTTRIELNSSGNLLAAYYDNDSYIGINPNYGGAPGLVFAHDNGAGGGVIFPDIGALNIVALDDLYLNATVGSIKIPSWSKLYSKGAAQSLQTALNGKANTIHTHSISDVNGLQTALNGKASSGSSTGTAGPYNCGIPIGTIIKDANGNAWTWAGVPAHSHTQS